MNNSDGTLWTWVKRRQWQKMIEGMAVRDCRGDTVELEMVVKITGGNIVRGNSKSWGGNVVQGDVDDRHCMRGCHRIKMKLICSHPCLKLIDSTLLVATALLSGHLQFQATRKNISNLTLGTVMIQWNLRVASSKQHRERTNFIGWNFNWRLSLWKVW